MNKWIESNISKINAIAKQSCHNWRELVVELYFWLEDGGWEKIKNYTDDGKLRFINRWFTNQNKWVNTSLKSKMKLNSIDYIDINESDISAIDFIYIMSENADISTKEWIYDLTSVYTDEQINMLISIRLYYEQLDLAERNLFELIYNKKLSLRKTAKILRIPTSSVAFAVKGLNKKIRENVCGMTSSQLYNSQQ